ncbi:DUF2742 domain-containing protein [Mycobacterium sp. 050272]|uniref:DUF2742 domain-containing protein n=1 Tax=Mycobacterium sp. 050272 TaxID=3142488 RepID=UPI00319CE8AF
MSERKGPGANPRPNSTTPIAAPQSSASEAHTTSQQVSWAEAHRFIDAIVAQANSGPLPMAGTPTWCALADGDLRKLLALAVAGEHHVLRIEVAQTARADASRAISTAANWAAVAHEVNQLDAFYRQRPWLRRGGVA